MRRMLCALVAVALPTANAGAEDPSPRELIAQSELPVDDSDLKDEESLNEMNKVEIEERAGSVAAAVGLSFIPGGGFGLIYAKRPYASVVPFVLSAAGYGIGATYLLGVFDESKKTVCKHTPSASRVEFAECSYGTDPATNTQIDPRSGAEMRRYFETVGDYGQVDVGEDFDGQKTGIYIIGATYLATSVLGAVWAGSAVAADNEVIRKEVESTASVPRPMLGYDGRRGFAGLSLDF